jgi:hypothetical protein
MLTFGRVKVHGRNRPHRHSATFVVTGRPYRPASEPSVGMPRKPPVMTTLECFLFVAAAAVAAVAAVEMM